jgi:hypothetical protein
VEDNSEQAYLWTIEWDLEALGRGHLTVMHHLTLRSGVTPQDFETFMKEEVAPSSIVTRVGTGTGVSLLRESPVGDFGLTGVLPTYVNDDLEEKFATLCTVTSSSVVTKVDLSQH